MTKVDNDAVSPEAQNASGEWARISAAMTDAIDLIAGRKDIIVSVAPGAGGGSKACFHEDAATMEISGDVLTESLRRNAGSTDLSRVRPLVWDNRNLYPDVWGLLVHEGAHAKHTRWKRALWPQIARGEIGADLIKAAELLEEVRAENAHLDRRPWDTRWLRASAAQHLLGDDVTPEQLSTQQAAARVATLVGGRVSAGVIDNSEVTSALSVAEAILGEARMQQLRDIVKRALHVRDKDADSMLALAREWLDVAGVSPEPDGGSPGSPGDGNSDLAAALAQALKGASQEVGKNGGQQDAGGKWWSTGIGGTTPVKFRRAEPSERTQAAALARRLRTYLIPDRSVTRVQQAQPPGRLDMSAALTRSAQEAMGLLPESEPWFHLDRRVLPTPPLRVGISVDVSGSLESIAPHSMRLAYVLSTALAALPDSRVTTAVFGSDHQLWPVKAGEVPVYKYNSGTQAETAALRDLIDRCAFWQRSSARLFIEVGDAQYDYSDMIEHAKLYRLLTRAGVRIIFLWQRSRRYSYSPSGTATVMTMAEQLAELDKEYAGSHCLSVPGVHVIPISGGSSPEEAVSAVIDDIVRLLTSGRA